MKNKFVTLTTALILWAGLVIPARAEIYTLDNSHSTIGFSVKHLMVSDTRGEFTDYTGVINFDPADTSRASFDVSIKAASINTRNEDRDTHLRKPDFFDVANHPDITFKSKSLTKDGEDYLLTGELTMRGVTKEINIPVKISGPVKSPRGFTAIGLAGKATVNRQNFGISWNKQLDQGGYMVGDEVTIDVNVEAHNG